jgi:hypothetical protein
VLALVGIAATARPLAAQEAPDATRACYVPAAGTVYRIGEPGLPSACAETIGAARHVGFSWPEASPQGALPDPTAAALLGVEMLAARVRELEVENARLEDIAANLANEMAALRAQFERLEGERR